MPHRICIVGAGAVGSYIGGWLRHAGMEVFLFDDWRDHVDAVRSEGLAIEDIGHHLDVRALPVFTFQQLSNWEFKPDDYIFICAKLYQTAAAVAAIKPNWHDGIPVVTIQNGLVENELADAFGPSNIIGGIATGLNVELVRPGMVRRGSRRRAQTVFQVGEFESGRVERITELARILSLVDNAEVVHDLRDRRWRKLSYNALTSGLTALTRSSLHHVYNDPRAHEIMIHLGHEALLVGEAQGNGAGSLLGVASSGWLAAARADRPAKDLLLSAFLDEAKKISQHYTPGMLLDTLRGRPTEVDYFNGFIARTATRLGMAAPHHCLLARLIPDNFGSTKPYDMAELHRMCLLAQR
ncbi:MAG: 2-dehydropantoate 2-reductase [Candidimonas sp.]